MTGLEAWKIISKDLARLHRITGEYTLDEVEAEVICFMTLVKGWKPDGET